MRKRIEVAGALGLIALLFAMMLFDVLRHGHVSAAETIIPYQRGGTSLDTATDDSLWLANGSAIEHKTVPDCDATDEALRYDTTTNAFTCGTGLGAGATNEQVVVVTGTASATATTQSFTSTGFGTPVAAMFFMTNVASDDTVADDLNTSIGFTDGTTEEVTGGSVLDASSPQDSHHTSDHAVIQLYTPGTATLIADADFSAWVTDGVEVTWNTVTTNEEKVIVVLFGGGMQAKVEHFTPCTAVDCTTTVSVGFEPNSVIIMRTRTSTTPPDDAVEMNRILGFASDDGSSTALQRSTTQLAQNGAQNSELHSCSDCVSTSQGTPRYELHTWTDDGFSVSCRDATCNTYASHYLALRGTSVAVGGITIPADPPETAPVSVAVTGVGFEPQAVLLMGTQQSTVGDDFSGDPSGTMAYGVMDGTTEASICAMAEDSVGSSNASSYYSTAAYDVRDPTDGTVGVKAEFESFDPDGFTLNATTILSGSTVGFFLAFGPLDTSTTPAHIDLLDANMHQDTTESAVTRGDIIYGNSTPEWDDLAIGAANTYLSSDGTDVSWAAVTRGTIYGPSGIILNTGAGNTQYAGLADDSNVEARAQWECPKGGCSFVEIRGYVYSNTNTALENFHMTFSKAAAIDTGCRVSWLGGVTGRVVDACSTSCVDGDLIAIELDNSGGSGTVLASTATLECQQ